MARLSCVLCPVFVFRLLRQNALDAKARYVAQCGGYTTLHRHISNLFEQADVPVRTEGRDRNVYAVHSRRVAAVCSLLRAGLSEVIVKALANWSSDEIRRYAHQVIFNPELVEPWPFYNPDTASYSARPRYSRPPKPSLSASVGPATGGADPNPDPAPGSPDGLGRELSPETEVEGTPVSKRGRPCTRPPKIKRPRDRPLKEATGSAGGDWQGPEGGRLPFVGRRRRRAGPRGPGGWVPPHAYSL